MANIWVIPDIHGCIKTFSTLIEKLIFLKKEDTLYLLGDYIDRGPNSKATLDYIISLQENGYNVVALMGNHEEYFIRAWEENVEINKKSRYSLFFLRKANITHEWFKHGGKEMLESFGVDDILQIPEKYYLWIKERPYYVILDKYILVHAGFNFNIENIFEDTHAMLWIRNFDVDLNKTGNRRIIHGHLPVKIELILESIKFSHYNFIPLDNGCIYKNIDGYGNLTALNLKTMELLIQPNID